VNKLGEYLVALPPRRRRILLDQKYPPDFKTLRYANAQRAVVECLCCGRDPLILERHAERIRTKSHRSHIEAESAALCLQALSAFGDILPGLELGNVHATRPNLREPKFIRHGVRVSIRPDVLLSQIDAPPGKYVGAIKLCFSKTRAVSQSEAGYIGAILRQHTLAGIAGNSAAPPKLCLLIDVFARTAHTAPRAHKQRLTVAESACEEIAARWSSL
jgi:hypothetical protein